MWSTRTAIMFIQLAWLWLETKLWAALPVLSLGRLEAETYLRMFCEIGLRRFEGITLLGKIVRVPLASAVCGSKIWMGYRTVCPFCCCVVNDWLKSPWRSAAVGTPI